MSSGTAKDSVAHLTLRHCLLYFQRHDNFLIEQQQNWNLSNIILMLLKIHFDKIPCLLHNNQVNYSLNVIYIMFITCLAVYVSDMQWNNGLYKKTSH